MSITSRRCARRSRISFAGSAQATNDFRYCFPSSYCTDTSEPIEKRMQRLSSIIERAQTALAQLITRSAEKTAWTPTHYQRYLSMQYHLTHGVQRYFFTAAAHPS